ncbi:putative glucan endo-1,3-beta-glucosidase bg3 [Castilleja foliolosa]|uniref:Glucan endo-1,3-beta-glucosidase bg3 n=1 Tax=Castilleja foliolosa TaxID=1961234 RepID=A0ABD3CRL0_9LAMI
MANSHFSVLIALLLLCLDSTSVDAQIGVVYGTKISNPPPAKEVIELCIEHRITRMRLYEPNHQILEALKGSNISVILGVPNEVIPKIAENTSFAQNWLQTNLINYPGVDFRYIEVGNNINPLDKSHNSTAKYVVPAMQNMANAVDPFNRKLPIKIKVSTTIDPDIRMNQEYYNNAWHYVFQVLEFLVTHGYPLFTNLHPYSSYMSNPENVTLDSVLFKSDKVIQTQKNTSDKNWFDLYVDDLYEMLDHARNHTPARGLTKKVKVIVSETGWPTADGIEANVENARTYNTNLIQHVRRRSRRHKVGSRPRRRPVETYIVGLFDEDLKKPEYNKNFGLFDAKMKLKYPITFW